MSNEQRAGVLTGYRRPDGSFNNRGYSASFWSSSESGASAWVRDLYYSMASVYRGTFGKANAFSAIYEVQEGGRHD